MRAVEILLFLVAFGSIGWLITWRVRVMLAQSRRQQLAWRVVPEGLPDGGTRFVLIRGQDHITYDEIHPPDLSDWDLMHRMAEDRCKELNAPLLTS